MCSDPAHQDIHPSNTGAANNVFYTPTPLRAPTQHTLHRVHATVLIPVVGTRTPTLARGSSNSTLPQGHQHTYDVFMCNRMGRRTPRGTTKPRHAMMMTLHTFAGNAHAIVSHTTPHTTLIQYRAQISSGSAPDLPRLPGLHCHRA